MAAPTFETVADDLVPCASAIYSYLRAHGYGVRVEVANPAAPFTPTLRATRGSTTLHVEVTGNVNVERLREWAAYGKSGASDTRFAACVPTTAPVSIGSLVALGAAGIGLFLVDGVAVAESIPAADLAMHVELPALAKQPAYVRRLLGHAYEQFGRGEWREGFETACNALEEEARRYFAYWSRTGRLTVASPRGARTLTAKEIRTLTLGQLAGAFRNILAPNSLDVTIEQALAKINPDRVERTHRRHRKRTESRLRQNVGQHMWLIVNILRRLGNQ